MKPRQVVERFNACYIVSGKPELLQNDVPVQRGKIGKRLPDERKTFEFRHIRNQRKIAYVALDHGAGPHAAGPVRVELYAGHVLKKHMPAQQQFLDAVQIA